MFWEYSRSETKLLLNATLVLFAAYAIVAGQHWGALSVAPEAIQATSVGIYAEVEENEVNKLVAQLDAKEKELAMREQALIKSTEQERYPLVVITVIGFGLLGLILLNFYLDSRRRTSLA